MSIFSETPIKQPQKSTFNLSNDNKLSLEMGYIVPVKVFEVLPGDEVKMDVEAFVRLQALMAPVMQDFSVIIEAFFEPWRLLMPDGYMESFQDPETNLSLPIFQLVDSPYTHDLVAPGTLWDYLGFPTRLNAEAFGGTDSFFLSLPFKMYQDVYNKYYRDENVIDEVNIYKDEVRIIDQIKVQQLMTLRKRCYKKDYFTSALPDAQRGGDIMMPVEGDVTIGFNPNSGPTQVYGKSGMSFPGNTLSLIRGPQQSESPEGNPVADVTTQMVDGTSTASQQSIEIDNSKSLFGRLIGTNTPLESLRRAMTVQGMLELFARTGGRLKERLLALWGTAPKDLRLDRPEFLGQAISPLVIGEVLQTSSSNASAAPDEETTPQGNMAGHAVALNSGHLFQRTFDEHGYVMVMLSVVPKASYFQGMPRKYSRRTYFDVANPMLAHLGEQEVKQGELMWQAPNEEMSQAGDYSNDQEFGYQSRYAEYKFEPNEVHGEFRSTLSYWHGARIFDPLFPPRLNADFLEVQTPEQIFAVQATENHTPPQRVLAQVAFNMEARRCLPYYGVPQFPHL